MREQRLSFPSLMHGPRFLSLLPLLHTYTPQVYHLKYGKLVVGNHRDDPGELAKALALWEGTRIEVETAPSLLRARWMKLMWNVPFNGLSCILGALRGEGRRVDDGR